MENHVFRHNVVFPFFLKAGTDGGFLCFLLLVVLKTERMRNGLCVSFS